MFHLIERLIPAPLHRAALRLAHDVRHRFRSLVKPRLAGVSVIVRDEGGRILLVRHSYGSGVWTLPGGGCGKRENPDEAARRELAEELALELAELEQIARLEETISGAPHTAHLFAARADGTPRPDQREVIEARFFDADALPPDTGRLARSRIAAWRAVQP